MSAVLLACAFSAFLGVLVSAEKQRGPAGDGALMVKGARPGDEG